MATLARHGPCTINEIAELERIRAPSASKLVAGLEERGLAERRRDSEDRRRSVITLSREGERLLADMRAAGMSWLAARLDTLDGSDRRAVRDALPALERLLGTET